MFKVKFKLLKNRLYGFISWFIEDYSGKMALGYFSKDAIRRLLE